MTSLERDERRKQQYQAFLLGQQKPAPSPSTTNSRWFDVPIVPIVVQQPIVEVQQPVIVVQQPAVVKEVIEQITIQPAKKRLKAPRRRSAPTLKTRCYAQNRRARCLGLTEQVTEADLQAIIDRDVLCQVCGTNRRLTFDHIQPLARGGRHHLSNLQLLCLSCNCRKSTRE